MTPFLQLALALALIILTAKLGGYLSLRLGQPSVLGELLVGLILGPSVVDFLHISYFTDTHLPEVIHELAEMGVLLLMFLAGLDLHINDLLRSSKVAALAGTLGVVLPLALGTIVGVLFGMAHQPAIFIGLIISATSVSISAQVLMELKVLRSRVGMGLLGAAVFDDILVLLILSIFTALTQSGTDAGFIDILWIAVKMLIFLGGASVIGWWLFPKMNKVIGDLPISQGLVAFTFVTVLMYGWLAETIGHMAAITGAFVAGLWFNRTPEKEQIRTSMGTIAYGIFVPVFFIDIGLSVNARQLNWDSLLLFLVILVVAVIGKVAGSGSGALIGGYTRREALQLGVGMVSRGEVGLIVAAIGIDEGLISPQSFSAVVAVVIVTTVLTPLMLRALFPKTGAKRDKAYKTIVGA